MSKSIAPPVANCQTSLTVDPPPTALSTEDANAVLPKAPATGNAFEPERFRTRLCKTFRKTGECPYGPRCMFAHGKAQLRTKRRNVADGLVSEAAVRAFQNDGSDATPPPQPRRTTVPMSSIPRAPRFNAEAAGTRAADPNGPVSDVPLLTVHGVPAELPPRPRHPTVSPTRVPLTPATIARLRTVNPDVDDDSQSGVDGDDNITPAAAGRGRSDAPSRSSRGSGRRRIHDPYAVPSPWAEDRAEEFDDADGDRTSDEDDLDVISGFSVGTPRPNISPASAVSSEGLRSARRISISE
eukprot:CAMPEP_0174828180 /NCGR_PEP_ID=MMETSP1114-20130205/1181_1 /TAXON_ID=312471 /ORGANISM="Neobodo designis, Strain CCAP 1951/1" /LENGTH=296 /DNA_ID=CAMNT_0016061891 /DNA_START=45 /DNA_END=935 /DNA_ORIENTATION=-